MHNSKKWKVKTIRVNAVKIKPNWIIPKPKRFSFGKNYKCIKNRPWLLPLKLDKSIGKGIHLNEKSYDNIKKIVA